jgi:riboflavin kinase/FMN adenylyltransferase
MKYLKNTTEFYIEESTVLSLGKFDGIHRGHELLMEHLASKKKPGSYRRRNQGNLPYKK